MLQRAGSDAGSRLHSRDSAADVQDNIGKDYCAKSLVFFIAGVLVHNLRMGFDASDAPVRFYGRSLDSIHGAESA
jgi:hypothetical protein